MLQLLTEEFVFVAPASRRRVFGATSPNPAGETPAPQKSVTMLFLQNYSLLNFCEK
jgi:hypothetical protein